MKKGLKSKILALCAIFFCAVITALVTGSVKFSVSELLLLENRSILNLRIMRVLVGMAAGCGLAVSGVALQAILRNPLAEPYLLGTSSGAGLGVVIAIILGLSSVYLPLAGFVAAVLTVILVYNLARQGSRVGVQSLVLSGVIVSIAFSAIIVFLVSISSHESLHEAMWWLWGSMQVYDVKLLITVMLIVAAGVITLLFFAQDLNAISIGEEEAIHLGIEIETIKKTVFFVTALVTAALVSMCGIIGFVGLIVPHMMRRVIGPNHKVLIPATCLAAAAFMIACDTLSRTLFSPLEIPIGVITAVVGAPLFIVLMKNKQRVI